MTDLISSDWKELDADNTQPSPNGVAGGYSPSSVAPIIRSIRGSLKRFYNQANPVYTSTGTGNAYVLTFEAAPAGYSKGIIYRFWAHATNTGAATLNINQLGTKAIVSGFDGSPLIAGQIVSGRAVEVVYNGTAFELISLAFTPVQQGGGTNQGTAKISLGMSSGNRLLMQADSTDYSDTFPININGNATTLAGYTPSTLPVSTPVQTAFDTVEAALSLKSPLASPVFTGTPTAPTPAQGNNSTRLATTAYVDTGLAGKLNTSGGVLAGGMTIVADGGSGAPLLGLRNTNNGNAVMSFGAAGRTTALATIGQRVNGNTFIGANTNGWDFAPDGTLWLPGGGRLGSDGNVFLPYFNEWISNILARSNRLRYGGVQWADVR
ncbi:hypothetical protein AGRO_3091, partial [Agrobacterium sp. ATCC 31749]|uniref:hypothetical protein n=1 Tax=Agrobacterium sp. CGMCC 11546 TaxID=2579248 RepID=UPI00020DB85F